MAYRVIQNRKNLSATVLFTANAEITVVGNTSVSVIATGDEDIAAVNINHAWFGSPSGDGAYWELKRGANTIAVFDSTAFLDFAGVGTALNVDDTATISVTLNGSSKGFLLLELQKKGQFNSEYLVP